MSTDIPESDNFDPVPGVKYDDKPAVPAEAPKEPEKASEPTAEPEKVQEPAKPEAVVEPVRERPKKAGPIADLLEKKHLSDERAEKAEAEAAELRTKLEKLSQQPASSQVTDKVKQIAETYGLDETLIKELVEAAKDNANPALPKEVQDLLAERQAEKEQQVELEAFNKRVDSLAKTLPNEMFSDPKVREKLQALAYSTEKAPDGEPYFQKELSELYFAYIKPEVEPGETSAEPSRGGTQGTKVIDFEEIYNKDDPKDIEQMDSPTFEKYNAWVKEHKESRTPLKRSG